VVALVAGTAGKVAARIGFRPVLAAGALCFAAGLLWYVLRVEATPDYLGVWLPGTLVVGFGIGLTFPVLSAAAVSSLPAHRFAVGSAVNQTVRQIGGAIGVAILVLIIGTPDGPGAATATERFSSLWTFCAATALTSGALGTLIPRPGTAALGVTDEGSPGLAAVEADLPVALD
jgi:hypothetical protein